MIVESVSIGFLSWLEKKLSNDTNRKESGNGNFLMLG